MKTPNRKKLFRVDAEGKKKLTPEGGKLVTACVALAAIAVVLLFAGVGFFGGRLQSDSQLTLKEMQKSMTEQMQAEMETASDYLEKLDDSIAENQKKLETVNEQLTKRQESLTQVETTQKKLSENATDVSGKVSELEKNTSSQISGLQENMEFVHQEIQTILEQIRNLVQAGEEQKQQNASDQAQSITEITKVSETVQEINSSIADVENHLGESYEKLKNLLAEFKEQESEGKDDMVKQLSSVEKNLKVLLDADMNRISDTFTELAGNFQSHVTELERLMSGQFASLDENLSGNFRNLGQNLDSLDSDMDQLGNGLDNLNSSMGNLGSEISSQVGGLNTGIGDLNETLNGSFDQLSQSLAKQFGDLTLISGQNSDALKEYLNQLRDSLAQELNQVFTSVSNGKKGLASALLTKGVATEEDATFARIRDAILNIDQKLVIGVQELPGTIQYEYHYHTDAAGGNPHTEESLQQGGCYTIAHYHVHSKEAGCYEVKEYHQHTDDCPGHAVWVDWDGEGYWGYIYECNDKPLNASKEELVCEKSTDTVDSYLPSCGLADGQIVGATIRYDRDAASAQAQAVMEREESARAAAKKQQAALLKEEETGKLPSAPQAVIEAMENRQETQAAEAEPVSEPETPEETQEEKELVSEPETQEETEPASEPEMSEETELVSEPEMREETEPVSEPEMPEETQEETQPLSEPETPEATEVPSATEAPGEEPS